MQPNLERGKVWMKKSEDCKIWQLEEFFFYFSYFQFGRMKLSRSYLVNYTASRTAGADLRKVD